MYYCVSTMVDRKELDIEILKIISKKIDNGTFNDKALIFDDKIGLNDFKRAVAGCVNLQAPCASKEYVSAYHGNVANEYTDNDLSHPWTLLTCAIHYRKYDKAKILLEAGANIHHRRTAYDKPAYYYMGSSLLSDVRMIDLCLLYGADINYSDDDGYSILHSCGATSSFEFYKALVNKGANIYKRTKGRNKILPIHSCISTSGCIEDNIMKFKLLIALQSELKPELFDYINNMEFMSQDNKKKFK